MIEVTLEEVRAAAERIRDRVRRTPLREVPWPEGARAGVRLFLKLECEQVSGAFKGRGANHFIVRLLESAPDVSGVVTYSSGNHGRAVAEAAAAAGIAALVVVPDHVDVSKAASIAVASSPVGLSPPLGDRFFHQIEWLTCPPR